MSKGGGLGGGTWWDDTRDEPIFGDQMPVFEIDNFKMDKVGINS
jgi:hypothetical protein